MQTELTVIIPTADNDGRTLQPVIDEWEAFLLDRLGGYTRENVTGAWKDDSGKVYHDASYRYTLTGKRIQEVSAALPEWCLRLRQEALYATRRNVGSGPASSTGASAWSARTETSSNCPSARCPPAATPATASPGRSRWRCVWPASRCCDRGMRIRC